MSELPRAAIVRSAARRAAPWLIALAAIAIVLAVRARVATAPLARLAPGAAQAGDPPGRVWTGSLALPRGGPYMLGFQSPGPALLELTGDVVPAGQRFA
ncbi:MAG TPA: hypothetical protein VHE35_26010, partial [Kofleriaceae bacterium]|nr:hypothetical protein [Kofleriaceae bacterium]